MSSSPSAGRVAGVRALEDLIRDVGEFRRELTDGGDLAVTGVLVTRADRTLVRKLVGQVGEPPREALGFPDAAQAAENSSWVLA